MPKTTDEFFVAYFPMPPRLRVFLLAVGAVLILAFAGLAYVAGASQDDPGNGSFRFDFGQQTLTGIIEMSPYPLLRVTTGSEQVAAGHTLMLSGGGKIGVAEAARRYDGQLVTLSGIILKRGDLDMLQVRGNSGGIKPADGAGFEAPSAPESLGRWLLSGEICDGKCLAGAMRPGKGLAHKACANLCVIGGVPPVFVSTQAVEGYEYLLMAGPEGGTLPQSVLDNMAAFVRIEGEIVRHGDLLVFTVDPTTIEVF
jgi:hypothetical protein